MLASRKLLLLTPWYQQGQFKGSVAAFDFVNGRGYQKGVGQGLANLLSTTRASSGWAETAGGTWVEFPSNVARITDKGLLSEEARTNSLRNNSMQGGSAPSTLPTNWSIVNSGGLTVTYSYGTVRGIEGIYVAISGTPSDSNGLEVRFETTTGIAASNTQTWTNSAFVALTAGGLTNVSAVRLVASQRDSGGSAISTLLGTDFKASLTASAQRFSAALVMDSASTNYQIPGLQVGKTSGSAISLTLFIGWPQAELGAYVTSPIRTTGSAATRAADRVTAAMTATLAGSGALSAYAEFDAPLAAVLGSVFALSKSARADGEWLLNRDTQPKVTVNVTGPTFSNEGSLTSAGTYSSVPVKVAVRAETNSFAMSVGGATIVSDTSGTMPTDWVLLRIGERNNDRFFNSYIRRLAISTQAWGDGELISRTQ